MAFTFDFEPSQGKSVAGSCHKATTAKDKKKVDWQNLALGLGKGLAYAIITDFALLVFAIVVLDADREFFISFFHSPSFKALLLVNLLLVIIPAVPDTPTKAIPFWINFLRGFLQVTPVVGGIGFLGALFLAVPLGFALDLFFTPDDQMFYLVVNAYLGIWVAVWLLAAALIAYLDMPPKVAPAVKTKPSSCPEEEAVRPVMSYLNDTEKLRFMWSHLLKLEK